MKIVFNNMADFAHVRGLLLLPCVLLWGCGGGLGLASEGQLRAAGATRPWLTARELEVGRTVFIERCGSCHSLPLAESRSPSQWPGEVARMATVARLTGDQQAQIEAYLVAMSSPR